MDIQVITKNVQIEPELKGYAEQKLTKLNRYLNSINSVKVELSKEKSKSRQQSFSAQCTLNINGFLIRGEHKADNMRAAIDEVADVMERLIERYKKRYEVTKSRNPESIRKPAEEIESKGTDDDTRIVKVKRFLITPMTVAEAIDQMEFLGHDFFVFMNRVDDSIQVVYRRDDGEYGVIVPRFS